MTVDPQDTAHVLALARLLGLEEACQDDLAALAAELIELLAEGNVQAAHDLGDLGPAVRFEPTG
jgi:hypothetical protein